MHDAARPFAAPDLFTAVIEADRRDADGAIPIVPVADTVKRVVDDVVTDTLDRTTLALGPDAAGVRRTAACAPRTIAPGTSGAEFTDDASVMEDAGHRIVALPGDPLNTKITTLFDLARRPMARMGGSR